METYILVHGAWHGAWCWGENFVKALENNGQNTVVCVNLPGHGHKDAYQKGVSIQDYVKTVKDVIDNEYNKENEKVIVLGHSLAGITITKVAEDYSEKISMLIYLAAYVPIVHGGFMCSLWYNPVGIKDIGKYSVSRKEDKFYIKDKKNYRKYLLYGDCTEEDVEHANELLCEEPFSPMLEKIEVSPEYYGKVEKYYIHTKKDKILPEKMQKRMLKSVDKRGYFFKTASIDTSHSPFICKPKELAEKIFNLKNIDG